MPGSRVQSQRGSREATRRMVTVTGDEINKLMGVPDVEPVILSTTEYSNLKSAATILTKEQKNQLRMQSDAKFREKSKRSEARKQKMLRMEKERSMRKPRLTASQREEKEKNAEILTKAKKAYDSQWDDVKQMDSMMQYAKCVTIRDAQILEKQQLQEEAAAEDRLLDMMMEVERVKAIKMEAQKNQLRTAERKAGAAVLMKQIAEREQERIRQQEIREQEAKVMVERIRELELREEEERLARMAAGRRMLDDVLRANAEQAKAKLVKKQQEIAEDLQIAEYIRQKEMREQEMEREQLRIKAKKEKETARLRALQEKAADRQSQIDELRAKRYQEERDRAWRASQLANAQKKEAQMKEILGSRDQQRKAKARQMAEQALQEREEYYNVLEVQRRSAKQEDDARRAAQDARYRHKEEIMRQIKQNEKTKIIAREKFLKEGKKLAAGMASDVRRLEVLKQQRLADLQRAGVPEKYRSELAKKKLLVPTIH